MFEELNQSEPKSNVVPPVSKTPPPVTGRPVSSLKTPEVEDIFSKTDHGQSKVVRPVQPGQAVKIPVSPLEEDKELFGGRKLPARKIILILLAIILILVITGAVWGVFRLAQPGQEPVGNANVNIPVNNSQVNQNQTVPHQEVNAPVDVVLPKDSDGDGLTDEEEKGLGTDSNKADSDGDGLNDRAEIMLFKTNPLNPDTDGDGYLDGKEVINGYDPNKPGNARLYQTP